MKKNKQLTGFFSSILFSTLLLIACNNDKKGTEEEKMDVTKTSSMDTGAAMATINGTVSDTIVNGTVEFMKENEKVKMTLNISIPKMADKSVAIHLHEMGDCGDMGKDAHGHWNPTNQQHGKWGTGSFHSGDIGNLKLDAEGKGILEIETDLWTIGGDITTDILNKSVIVHSGFDDYTSQPSGNAGSRIGCGVIMKK